MRLLVPSNHCGHVDPVRRIATSMNLEWLFTSAGQLAWCDTVLMTEVDFAAVAGHPWFQDELDRECANLLFERMHSEGVVTVFDHTRYLPEVMMDAINE